MPTLHGYFARDPSMRARYDHLRRHAGGGNHNACNLRREGCLSFARGNRDGHGDDYGDESWATLSAAERRRGVSSMAMGTAVSRFRRFASTDKGFRDRLGIAKPWAALFLLGVP